MSFEDTPTLQAIESEPEPKPACTLEEIYQEIQGDELLEELYQDVASGVDRYFSAVLSHARAQTIHQYRLPPEEFRKVNESRDNDRRVAHNALVDRLRILTRTAAKEGRSTDWWNKITGLRENRYLIGGWAIKVSLQKALEKAKELDSEEELR